MRVTTHADPRSFAELARPLLLRDEPRHCLMLGIVDTLLTHPERYESCQLFSIAGADGLAGVAWRTAPHPLGLSSMSSAAVSALVEHLAVSDLSGVVGAQPEVDQFKDRWLERRGRSLSHGIQQRIYRLERVVGDTLPAPGGMRVATRTDSELVVPGASPSYVNAASGTTTRSYVAVPLPCSSVATGCSGSTTVPR
jgi:uncharacterized protein